VSLPIWMRCLDLLQDTPQDCSINPTGCISFGGHHMKTVNHMAAWNYSLVQYHAKNSRTEHWECCFKKPVPHFSSVEEIHVCVCLNPVPECTYCST